MFCVEEADGDHGIASLDTSMGGGGIVRTLGVRSSAGDSSMDSFALVSETMISVRRENAEE